MREGSPPHCAEMRSSINSTTYARFVRVVLFFSLQAIDRLFDKRCVEVAE